MEGLGDATLQRFLLIIGIIRLRERRGFAYWISRDDPLARTISSSLAASLYPIHFDSISFIATKVFKQYLQREEVQSG